MYLYQINRISLFYCRLSEYACGILNWLGNRTYRDESRELCITSIEYLKQKSIHQQTYSFAKWTPMSVSKPTWVEVFRYSLFI